MKLKATDTIQITAVRADPLLRGEEFEVDDAAGKSLVERGLAVPVKEKADPAATPNKAEGAAEANKAEGDSAATKRAARKPAAAKEK